MCLPFTCGSDGTRMHCGKKTSQWRESDATFCTETLGLGIHVDVHLTTQGSWKIEKHGETSRSLAPDHDNFSI